MKMTLNNWTYIQQKIREVGIEKIEYNSEEKLQSIITKGGERFEFSPEAFEQFKVAGLLKLGTRAR